MTARSLRPRSVSVLCALRQGPLTAAQLWRAIGDASTAETERLLAGMAETVAGAVFSDCEPFVAWRMRSTKRQGRTTTRRCWYLTHGGLGWLQSHGLDARAEACLWVVVDDPDRGGS
jgi:hypothetical protein